MLSTAARTVVGWLGVVMTGLGKGGADGMTADGKTMAQDSVAPIGRRYLALSQNSGPCSPAPPRVHSPHLPPADLVRENDSMS